MCIRDRPGLDATDQDPAATQTVPGRILAVTTSASSQDPLRDGNFAFVDIVLPTELTAGTYAVHARCGDTDLMVSIQIDADGMIMVLEPPTPSNGTGDLAMTGTETSPVVSMGIGLIGCGVFLVAISRRRYVTPHAS